MASPRAAHADLTETPIPHATIEAAAFVLFAKQVATYELPAAAAELEWDDDPKLRAFWRDQVSTVVAALRLSPVPDTAQVAP